MNSAMLDNIKLMLGIEDSDASKDKIINLYIKKVTQLVLNECNILELPVALEGFVEDKVKAVVEATGIVNNGGGSTNTGEIKSVTRGDTKIEYNVDGSSASSASNARVNGSMLLTNDELKQLKPFKRLRTW